MFIRKKTQNDRPLEQKSIQKICIIFWIHIKNDTIDKMEVIYAV